MTTTATRAKTTSGALAVDVLIESPRWQSVADAEDIVRRAVAAAADVVSTPGGELAIVLTDDSAIRALNHRWRGIDKATNVLSFPAQQADRALPPGMPRPFGDVVIACETVAREAEAEDKPVGHHLAHLAVHGFLHLLGHDHIDAADAETMEQLERVILARLGIPDPYAVHEAAEAGA